MNPLDELYETILERRTTPIEKSYTNYLFQEGIDKIAKKVGEEAMEFVLACKNNNAEDSVNEAADLIYHLLVLLANNDIPFADVEAELSRRQLTMGNLKEKHERGAL